MKSFLTFVLIAFSVASLYAQVPEKKTVKLSVVAPDSVSHGQRFCASYIVSGMEWDEYQHPEFDGYIFHSVKSNIVYEKSGEVRRIKYFKHDYELSATRSGRLSLPDIGCSPAGAEADSKVPVPVSDRSIFVRMDKKYSKELSALYALLRGKGLTPETFGLSLAFEKDELIVFNGEGNSSFFMVANGAYCELLDTPILAYSYECGISQWETEKFIALTDIYTDQLRHLRANGLKYESIPISSYTPQRTSVKPLLGKTAWGQTEPYNSLCPESDKSDGAKMVGCVPVALAQVMRCYEFPASMEGGYAYKSKSGMLYQMDFSNLTIDWRRIKDSYSAEADSDDDGVASVASLMAAAGVSVGADFGDEMTGANFGKLKMALVNFYGYSPACTEVRAFTEFTHEGRKERAKEVSADVFLGLTCRELDEGRPVIVSDFAHAFVCDGYEKDYLHFNLGWNGSCNGYYRMFVIPGYKDFPLIYKSMIIGIEPDEESYLDYSKVVEMKEPGTLSSMLTDKEKMHLHSLTVTGELDGSDMRLIRKMSGAVEGGDYFSWRGSLRHLDLSHASFKEGVNDSAVYLTVNARDIGFAISGNFKTVHKTGTKDELKEVSSKTEHVRYDFIDLTPEEWEDICARNMTYGKGYHLTGDSGKYYVNYLLTKGEIGTKMFEGCDNLVSITLPEETTKIGRYAFLDCHSLKTLNLPQSVDAIESRAFGNTYLLEKIVSHKPFDYDFGDDTYIYNEGFVMPE